MRSSRIIGEAAADEQTRERAVVLHNVGFSYGSGLIALRDIDLAVERGSIMSIIGPSGCGKSTLLAILASLIQPTQGHVEWIEPPGVGDGHPLTMLFQRDTLLPWLTVAGNVGLHFRFKGWRRKRSSSASQPNGSATNSRDQVRRVRELIDMAGLHGFEDRYPHELSGGMRRRVAFLSVVAPQPRVLLLDEPFTSLDEPSRIAIHQVIFDISRRFGITVLLVTHDLGEAISLSDEVLILTKRPGTVFDRYVIPFGRERRILELRQRAEFLQLYGKIWGQLSLQLSADRSNER